MKKIRMNLSQESINQAIKEIELYKQLLYTRIETLVHRLAEIGVRSVSATMMSVAPVDRGEFDVSLVYNKKGNTVCGARIVLSGDQVLFIEFSAGITFGTNSFTGTPNRPDYGRGYGMGTYPNGKGHWNDPTGWWYIGKWGEPEHTYGVRAYAPMYNADVEMRRQIQSIAKEVFNG